MNWISPFGRVISGKRIIYDEKYELQENDSEFLQSGTMQYQDEMRVFQEQGFFRISQFIWDPADPLFFLFKISPLSLCFHIENSLQMKRCQRGFLLPNRILLHLYMNAGLIKIRKKALRMLIQRQRWLRTNFII
ncbi:hypothetical protein HID58_094703 [Brassica napus]|uniref:Uncharacterized protein n=1 Tax=Brassica napus TaxID=3708 RepID=A0ABQ7X6D9_BRANA|nr:hypothetical protein HID58_094703 [Brassica napus]